MTKRQRVRRRRAWRQTLAGLAILIVAAVELPLVKGFYQGFSPPASRLAVPHDVAPLLMIP